MARMKVRAFSGEAPKISNHLLPSSTATRADNVDMSSGALKPLRTTKRVADITNPNPINSLYLFGQDTETPLYFMWEEDADVARGPIAGDTTERTYFTGTDAPRVTDSALAVTGSRALYPMSSYLVEVPAPTVAPNVTLGVGGSGVARSVAYVYTNVRQWASGKTDESPPSPASAVLSPLPGQAITVDTFEAVPAGDYNVTHRRIYRAATGSYGTDYLFVTEIVVATASHVDSALDSELGEVIEVTDWDAPPADMWGILALPNGVMAAVSGNEICLSVPYQPHAWPIRYRLTIPADVVGIANIGTMIVVCTNTSPYFIDATDPEYASRNSSSAPYPCLSKNGIVMAEGAVLYPTHSGLYMVTLSGGRLYTDDFISRKEWKNYKPDTMNAVFHDGEYIGFYDTEIVNGQQLGAGVVIGLSTKNGIKNLAYRSSALFASEDGEIHLVERKLGYDYVTLWNQGGGYVPYVWRSKLFTSNAPINIGAGQIIGDFLNASEASVEQQRAIERQEIIDANAAVIASGDPLGGALGGAGSILNNSPLNGDLLKNVPAAALNPRVNMRFYADGILVYDGNVSTNLPYHMGSGYLANKFQFEILGEVPVIEVAFASSKLELAR